MNQNQRFNIAHRGARSLAPENTMAAFHKAYQVGAHGVETDVSITKDGELILFHDETLSRTSNAAEVLPGQQKKGTHNFSYNELKQLDAGSWFVDSDPFNTIYEGMISAEEAESFRGLTIPRLEELLIFTKENDWFVNIEIKPLPLEISTFPVVEKVLRLIDTTGINLNNFSISSFNHHFIGEIASQKPDIEINALIGGKAWQPQEWGDYEYSIYNANIDKIDRYQLTRAWEHGCRVNLYTVNSFAQMKQYLAQGVEKIITDFPQYLSGWVPE